MLLRGMQIITAGWLVAAAAVTSGQVTAGAAPTQVLTGTVPVQARGATVLGPHDANAAVHLAIPLAPRDQAALNAFVAAVSDPRSATYGQYLDPAAFAARFGPAPATISAVQRYLDGFGFRTAMNGAVLLDADGTTAMAEAAFHVRLLDERATGGNSLQQGDTFYAPATEPTIPAGLDVLGVTGLSDVTAEHTSIEPSTAARWGGGPGPGGLTPSQIRGMYELDPLYAQGITGAGQHLALFELATYLPADVADYEAEYGLPQIPLNNVLVDGGCVKHCVRDSDEVTLDIEMDAAVAPGVDDITVYEGPNTNAGALDTYARIAKDDVAHTVSTSWGDCEANTPTAVLHAESAIFGEMAAQGQSIFAAAGDTGAFDCVGDGTRIGLGVDDPGSQPLMVSVGGTTIMVDPKKNPNPSHLPEKVWNEKSEMGGGLGRRAERRVAASVVADRPRCAQRLLGWLP